SSFPRDKICGDGLTPRAVAELVRMGVPTREDDGWIRNRGLRVVASGRSWELAWPDLASYPSYGMARARHSFDRTLAEHAQRTGAQLPERTAVARPVLDERTGPVVGVTARPVDDKGRRAGRERAYPAPGATPADRGPSPSARARRHRGRRRLVALRARPRPRTPRGPPDRRRRPHLLPHAPPRRPVDGVPPRAVGRRAPRVEPPAGLRLDLLPRRRHGERRPR